MVTLSSHELNLSIKIIILTSFLSYHALGYAGACLTHDFYNISGLPQLLGDSMVKTLVHVPNYRLRFFLRNFMKLFVLHCPGYHLMNVAIPILSPFFSYMVQVYQE